MKSMLGSFWKRNVLSTHGCFKNAFLEIGGMVVDVRMRVRNSNTRYLYGYGDAQAAISSHRSWESGDDDYHHYHLKTLPRCRYEGRGSLSPSESRYKDAGFKAHEKAHEDRRM